jgi:hypothetical protein
MKQLLFLAGFVCFVAILLPACAPAPEPEPEAAPEPVFDQAAEEAAIREAMEQMYAGANKHDVGAYTALMDENFESWDGRAKGLAAWGKNISDSWERQKDIQYTLLDEIGIQFMTPEVAIFKLYDEVAGSLDADGKSQPPYKRLVARVFVKKNGKWLYAALFLQPIEE